MTMNIQLECVECLSVTMNIQLECVGILEWLRIYNLSVWYVRVWL